MNNGESPRNPITEPIKEIDPTRPPETRAETHYRFLESATGKKDFDNALPVTDTKNRWRDWLKKLNKNVSNPDAFREKKNKRVSLKNTINLLETLKIEGTITQEFTFDEILFYLQAESEAVLVKKNVSDRLKMQLITIAFFELLQLKGSLPGKSKYEKVLRALKKRETEINDFL